MELIREYRAPQANAPVMVLFGGNPNAPAGFEKMNLEFKRHIESN